MSWDYAVAGEDGFEVGADEYGAVAGAADLLAEAYGLSSGDELLAMLGFEGDFGAAGYNDGMAGASVEELLAAAAGAAPRRPVMRGRAPMMAAARRAPMLARPMMRAPFARPGMPARPMMRPMPAAAARPALPSRPTASGAQSGARARRYPLNFDSVVEVPTGSVIAVSQRPQVPFKPDQLVVPSTIAPDFLIVSMSIGKNPQQAAVTPGSAVIYTETSQVGQIRCDQAVVGHEITLQVQNIAAAPRRFLATMLGEA
ncbi:MAG: hypothetical protein SFX73_00920, partial [Kofleriaceae bacterium]|nr:hypothetical protein [Kofleriaceae bacterium]